MNDELRFEAPHDGAGYTQMPNVVLLDPSLSSQAKVLYGCLVHHARSKGQCFPGQERLAAYLDLKSDRSVRGYIAELVDQALVRVERRGATKTNRYVILALGLRPRRLAEAQKERDRKDSSDQSDRKDIAGMTGRIFPVEEKEDKKTQIVEQRGRGRPRIGGKLVNADSWALTGRILEEFNRQTGKHLRLVTSAGVPSEAAKRVYGRVRDYPDLAFEAHAAIIARTLRSKWWKDDDVHIGVVYGPRVFEANIARRGEPKRDARQERNARRLEAVHRVIGGGGEAA